MSLIQTITYTPENEGKIVALLQSRNQMEHPGIQETVDEILKAVKTQGDEALLAYTLKFDKAALSPQTMRVTEQEIEEAFQALPEGIAGVMERAAERIREFHRRQRQNSWFDANRDGEILGQLVRPVQSCGVYVPGGKAAYPSSVLMNVIPAQIAGVERIVMVTPPDASGRVPAATIAAAQIAGVTEMYKAGGAQAIAALAYSTQTIPKVDKIVGPGNIYVALAKRSVFGYVSIDSVAGPSEILILADHTANPRFVAADMLSQAEHDPLASAILITDNPALAAAVEAELEIQTALLPRKDIIKESLRQFGAIVLTESTAQSVALSNRVAPEHLEVCLTDPFLVLPTIRNAGAIFLGPYSPEPLGDYMAGPNHILPTGGTARFFSPLGVDDFIKKSSVIAFSERALQTLADDVIRFAEAEGLGAHANAIRVRTEETL